MSGGGSGLTDTGREARLRQPAATDTDGDGAGAAMTSMATDVLSVRQGPLQKGPRSP